jgi:formylglycine-generating enzyme required for sulfatase activity
MKNLLSLVLIAFISLSFTPGGKNSSIKNFVYTYPNLHVAQFETTNKEYKEFLAHLEKTGSNKIEKYQPKSSMWTSYFKAFAENYFDHPAYDRYPVVNLSFESIQAYCQWKTDQYNSDPKRKFHKVVFRLPTEKEWKKFSNPIPGNNLPWIGQSPFREDKKGKLTAMANVKVFDYVDEVYNFTFDGGWVGVVGGKYEANRLGLYDVIGNVAEVTSDKIIKGGSWNNTIEECGINLHQDFDIQSPYVGFRVLMEVLEKEG